MSQAKQVMKLQEGKTIPASKKYGHLIIDGKDLGNSEEMINAFRDYSRRQEMQYGEFYSRWLNMLQNGQDVELTLANNVNDDGGLSKRAHSGWNKFWQAMSPVATRPENMRSAIANARRFNYAPVEPTINPNEYNNYRGSYDWDTKENKKIYSQNPGNLALDERFDKYLDWLEDTDTWEKNNKFKYAPADARLAGLKAWWNSMANGSDETDTRTQRERARAYIDDYLTRMRSANGWENVDEGIREFLDYFNIGE